MFLLTCSCPTLKVPLNFKLARLMMFNISRPGRTYSNLVRKLGLDYIIFYAITMQNQLLLFNLYESDPKLDPDKSVRPYTFSRPCPPSGYPQICLDLSSRAIRHPVMKRLQTNGLQVVLSINYWLHGARLSKLSSRSKM